MGDPGKKKTGNICAASGCKNKYYNCDKKFYRFPKDPERTKVWLEKCCRLDLMSKLDTLHTSSHRVCSAHFEPDMIMQHHKRKLLRENAVPAITFPRITTDEEGAEVHEEYPVQQSTENSDEDTTASQIGIINENVAVVNFFDFNDKTPEQIPSHKEIKKMSGENTANEALKDPDWLFFNAMVPDFKRLSETRKEALKTKFLFLLRQELNEYEREKSIRGSTSSTSHAHVQSTVACASSVSQRSAIDVPHDQRCSHEAPSPKYPTTNPISNQSQHQGTISTTKADKRLKAIKAPSHSLQHQQQVVTTVNRANKFTIAKLGNGATSTSQASSLQASTSSTNALPISEGDIKIEIEEEKLFDPSSREYIEYPNTAKRARIGDDTTNVPTICSVKQEIEDATEDQDLVEAIEVKKEPGDDEPDVADYLSVAQIKMEIGDDFVE